MDDELEDIYVEVPTEDDYEEYEEDDLALGDYTALIFLSILGCAVFAFIVRTISKHLKNVHLKVGNKIEIGVETKDGKKES